MKSLTKCIHEGLMKCAGTPILEQNRSEKFKEIYRALLRDHPEWPAEVKARIAARKSKDSPAERKSPKHGGPEYKAPLHHKRVGKGDDAYYVGKTKKQRKLDAKYSEKIAKDDLGSYPAKPGKQMTPKHPDANESREVFNQDDTNPSLFDKNARAKKDEFSVDELIDDIQEGADKRKRHFISAAAGGLAGAGAALLARRGIRAHVGDAVKSLVGRGGHAFEARRAASRQTPEAVTTAAKRVARQLKRSGVNPKKARIGISGSGGSGKSMLARELGSQLKMPIVNLDRAGKSKFIGRDVPAAFSSKGKRKGAIVEQTHLFTQLDPDKFDALVEIKRPMKQIRKDLLKRKRGAYQLDLYDNEKLQRDISTAFEMTKNKPKVVIDRMRKGGPQVRVKTRKSFFGMKRKFNADEVINAELERRNVQNIETLSRYDKIRALNSPNKKNLATRHRPGSLSRYVKKRPLVESAGAGILSGALAYQMGGDIRKRRKRKNGGS